MAKELSALEKSLIKNINKEFPDNEMVQLDEEGDVGKITDYVNTGVYALNWLISGKLHGGYPVGRIGELAGDPSTGKCASIETTKIKILNQEEKLASCYFEKLDVNKIQDPENLEIDCIKIIFEGMEFIVPELAKIKTERGWIKAKDLKEDDVLINNLSDRKYLNI